MYKVIGDFKVLYFNRFFIGLGENLDLCKVIEDFEDFIGGDRVVGIVEFVN